MVLQFSVCLILVSLLLISPTIAQTMTTNREIDREAIKEKLQNFRNMAYCEILSSRNRLGWSHLLEFTAYNTLVLGCDFEKWKDITPALVRSIDGALIVKLNGPRYWAFDTVSTDSALVDRTITVINGMDMPVVGIVHATLYEVFMNLFSPTSNLYHERNVDRKTEYIFRAGSPLNYLRSPEGKTYGMQSWATYVHNVTTDNLPILGSLLTMPKGWSYHHIPSLKKEFRLKAINAIGVIVTDNFMDVYSRFDSSLLREEVEATEAELSVLRQQHFAKTGNKPSPNEL